MFDKFIDKLVKKLSVSQLVHIVAAVIGIVAGVLAVVMKNSVHLFHSVIQYINLNGHFQALTPVLGILITVIIAKKVIKEKTGHGIPKVLYAISRRNGNIGLKNIVSSGLLSVLTVGFGGSAGLEGPSASAGAAIGSRISQLFRFEFKHVLILIGCGSSAAIAAIFNTPVAAILFSLEILMLDLSITSIIPLLISSVTGTVVAYFFLGNETLCLVENVNYGFQNSHIPIFIILGIIAGVNSSLFSKLYLSSEKIFSNIKTSSNRILIGGILIYAIFFIFPSCWGEGYDIMNMCINNDLSFLEGNILNLDISSPIIAIILLSLVFFMKIIATNITFGMGGVGGIFAPSLFIGAVTGLLATRLLYALNYTDFEVSVIVMVGMAGFMTGILHAPLTGIFLIAEISESYELVVPLIITSITAYIISKALIKNSVYTFELAKRKELLTHDKNQSAINKIDLRTIIERDFQILKPYDTILDLIEKIKLTKRNVFPVTDNNGYLLGVVTLEDVKKYIFSPNEFKDMQIREIMYPPKTFVFIDEHPEDIVRKLHHTGRFNIPVIENGKYLGFISRATIFTTYQKEVERVSNSSV